MRLIFLRAWTLFTSFRNSLLAPRPSQLPRIYPSMPTGRELFHTKRTLPKYFLLTLIGFLQRFVLRWRRSSSYSPPNTEIGSRGQRSIQGCWTRKTKVTFPDRKTFFTI